MPRCAGAAAPTRFHRVRRTPGPSARAPMAQSASAPRPGRTPARRFRPCRRLRPGSCRRSSRPNPSTAGHANRIAGRGESRARNARRGSRPARTRSAARNSTARHPSGDGSRGTGTPRRERRRHRWSRRSGRSPAAATDSRRSSAFARLCPKADATSAAHRLRGTGATPRATDARAPVAARRGPGPSRPATGRESRTRRSTGRTPCGPTGATQSPGRSASRWSARSAPDPGFAPGPRRASCASIDAPLRGRCVRRRPRASGGPARALHRRSCRRRAGRRSRALPPAPTRPRRAVLRRDPAPRQRGPTAASERAPPVPPACRPGRRSRCDRHRPDGSDRRRRRMRCGRRSRCCTNCGRRARRFARRSRSPRASAVFGRSSPSTQSR